MFWIHGGGLTIGSGTKGEYDPKYFMDTQSVVIVTINYRPGPFGFLSLGNENVPGNAGLRDQSMALAWVHENIVHFGEDPEKVTIFGESAGGSSAALHLVTPLSKGLFQRAILQSAWTGGWWSLNKLNKVLDYSIAFSKALGCEQMAENDMLNCLQQKNVSEIIKAQVDETIVSHPWTPISDYDFNSNPYLSKNIKHCLENGHFNTDVEVVIGTVADEGLLNMAFYVNGMQKWEDLKGNITSEVAKGAFNIANPAEITPNIEEKVHQMVEYYVKSTDNVDAEHLQGLVDMNTDAGFLYGSYRLTNYLVKHGMTVYQYIF